MQAKKKKKKAVRGRAWYRVADSVTALQKLPVRPACIITSPPYFNVRNYRTAAQIGYGQKFEEFMKSIGAVLADAYTCSKPRAALWIIADSIRQGGALIPLPFRFAEAAANQGWVLQSLIVWEKDRTYPWLQDGRVRKIHETIILMTKGAPRLRMHRLRMIDNVSEWWQRYPERYNPTGRAPADVWREGIPLQGSWGKSYLKHECPLPPALIERMIEMSTLPGDWVLDPFAGTGVVAATAAVMGRNGYAIDASSKFKDHFTPEVVPAVEEWWESRALERKRLEASRAAFFRANVALRLAKFARLVCEGLNDAKAGCVGAWVSARGLRASAPWCRPSITILLRNGADLAAVEQVAKTLAGRVPLSKFGVDASFQVISAQEFMGSATSAVYSTGTKLESFGRLTKTRFARICLESPKPLIASTLPIDPEDLLRIRTRYWKVGREPGYLASVLTGPGKRSRVDPAVRRLG